MLPHDPPSLHSPPPRPRRQKKHAPKKQPQRGLGVAQLEKLRLEEQSKQQQPQDAPCLPPFHQHLPPLSDARCFTDRHNQQVCLLKAGPFHVISPPLRSTEHQPPALVPWTKHDCCQNEGHPFLAFMSALPLSISLPPQQGSLAEHEPCLSSLSQVHDSSSSRSMVSGNISSSERFAEQLISDSAKGYNRYRDTPTFNVFMSQDKAGAGSIQIHETGRKPGINQGDMEQLSVLQSSELPGVKGSVVPREGRNQDGTFLSMDLCPFNFSLARLANPCIQPRSNDEALMVCHCERLPALRTVSPVDAESLELSSFQINSCDHVWSLSEQISGGKRPRIFGEDATDLKAIFLNPSTGQTQQDAKTLDVVENSVSLHTPTSIYGACAATDPSNFFRAPTLGKHNYIYLANRPSEFPLPGELNYLWSDKREVYCNRMLPGTPSSVSSKKVLCPKVDNNDFLTLGLSRSLWKVPEQSRLNGEDHASHNSGKLREAHLYHDDDDAAESKRIRAPCHEELNRSLSAQCTERNGSKQEQLQQKAKMSVEINLELSL